MGKPLSPPTATADIALVEALREILPHDAVVVEREALKPFESDGLMLYRALPLVAVLPESAGRASSTPSAMCPWSRGDPAPASVAAPCHTPKAC